MLQKNNLPNYHFGWTEGLYLFLGGIAPLVLMFTPEPLVNIFNHFLKYFHVPTESFTLLIGNILSFVGAILAFDFYVCRVQTKQKLNFDVSPFPLKLYPIILPLMLGMMLISDFLITLIPTTGPIFGELYEDFVKAMQILNVDFTTTLMMTVIFAPLFEEIIFRGIILKGLINKGMKPNKAIWFSAIIFGIVHGNPWQLLNAILLGYILGLVFYRTGTLLAPMILHGFNNLISVLLSEKMNIESDFSELFHLPHYITLILGLLIFIIFHYLFIRATAPKNSIQS